MFKNRITSLLSFLLFAAVLSLAAVWWHGHNYKAFFAKPPGDTYYTMFLWVTVAAVPICALSAYCSIIALKAREEKQKDCWSQKCLLVLNGFFILATFFLGVARWADLEGKSLFSGFYDVFVSTNGDKLFFCSCVLVLLVVIFLTRESLNVREE